jgi:hypothetical protein
MPIERAKEAPQQQSQPVEFPAIATFIHTKPLLPCPVSRPKLRPQLLPESQLVILELRRLEQPADLGPALAVGRSRVALLLLLLHQVELGIVARKLAERDEEVAQRKPELVVLRVEREQTLRKGRDLDPVLYQSD